MIETELEQIVLKAFERILTTAEARTMEMLTNAEGNGAEASQQLAATRQEDIVTSPDDSNFRTAPRVQLPQATRDAAEASAQEALSDSWLGNLTNTFPLSERRTTAPLTASRDSSGNSSKESSGSTIASTVMRAGFGTVPLARLVLGLFGGKQREEPPPLIRYSPPPAIRVEAANPRGFEAGRLALRDLRYDQDGLARAIDRGVNMDAMNRSEEVSEPSAKPLPQININVQAMDSRSFLDYSGDIASAVREAMLNMHSLNDVVNEL
jgi:hypothetical protein